MKNLFILFAIALLSFSTALALEPVKVAFTHSGTAPVSVEIKLTDYTGGTANTLYTQSAASYTPNGSGVIIATVADSSWATITPSQVNAYCVLDVYVGGDLYAQYRLDKLILSQSTNSILDNEGNLSPAESGGADLGNDDNRWGELFLTGNTLHVGPDGGMAGSNELAISYNDADSSAHFTVAGTDAFEVYASGDVVVPALGDGSSTQNLQVDASGKLVVGGGGGAFTSSGGTTKANSTTDNFFFGSGTFNNPIGTENKMYYDISNGSFRVGGVDGSAWNARGSYSFAAGFNTTASEANSVAMGISTTASGASSVAMGNLTNASGDNSMGIGNFTIASGDNSTAMGTNTVADNDNSTAMGAFNNNNITGELLTVGNGTGSSSRSNAFEVYMNGDVAVPALGNSTSTQNLQVDADGKLVVGGESAFTSSSGTTRANSETDNFFVGGGDFNHQSNTENKMYYDISNGSFRVGGVDGSAWDIRGSYSFAAGFNTTASGANSVAMGSSTTASETNAVAMGSSTTASEANAVAMGSSTTASGTNSVAMGSSTIASGTNSTAIGQGTKADADNSFVVGSYNNNIITDELFTVGNGIADFSRSNAFEIYTNGDVVVPALGNGTSTQNLQVDADGKLVVGGESAFTSSSGTTRANSETDNFFVGSGDFNYQSDTENKMYYDISNGSFRVGGVDGNAWDSRGSYSFASGFNTTASGTNSVALGDGTNATLINSIAFGNSTTSSGVNSVAMGHTTVSNGTNTVTMGHGTEADNDNSIAIGAFNDNSINDELLTIGNGTDDASRSNAFEVYENGNIRNTGFVQNKVTNVTTLPALNSAVTSIINYSGGGTIATSDLPTAPDGTMLYIRNGSAGVITILGTSLNPNEMVVCIKIAGTWYVTR
jgi:hypothetical protein